MLIFGSLHSKSAFEAMPKMYSEKESFRIIVHDLPHMRENIRTVLFSVGFMEKDEDVTLQDRQNIRHQLAW